MGGHRFQHGGNRRYQPGRKGIVLNALRDRIESAWQSWEATQLDRTEIANMDLAAVKQALQERAERDLDPPLSPAKQYLREEMTLAGYRTLLAIASLDGLVEGSRLSRILGGACNEIQATLIRVLLEEYGSGKLSRKHSTFFAQMMAELDLNTQPEGYFDLVPWQVLASINHNFLLTECKRYFLQYNGGLTYFEALMRREPQLKGVISATRCSGFSSASRINSAIACASSSG